MSNGEIILPGAFEGALPIRDDITILPADDPKNQDLAGLFLKKLARQ